MTRKPTFVTKVNVVKALNDLANISYFHKRQLVDEGYLEPVKVPEAKKTVGSRGRMPLAYQPTKKAANLVRLSKSWAAFREQAVQAVETAITGETQTEQRVLEDA